MIFPFSSGIYERETGAFMEGVGQSLKIHSAFHQCARMGAKEAGDLGT